MEHFVQPSDVLWTGDRFLMVGTEALPGEELASNAFVAESLDGQSWMRVRDMAFERHGSLVVHGLELLGDRVVIMGTVRGSGTLIISKARNEKWRASLPQELEGMSIRSAAMSRTGLASFGGCTFPTPNAGPPQAAVFTDGGTAGDLTAQPVPASEEESCIVSLRWTSQGLAASGFEGDRPVVWELGERGQWALQQLAVPPSVGRASAVAAASGPDLDVIVGVGEHDAPAPIGLGSTVVTIWTRPGR
jgi:hypothetical protein